MVEFSPAQVEFSLSYERIVVPSCLGYLVPKARLAVKGLPLGALAPLTGISGFIVSFPTDRKNNPS